MAEIVRLRDEKGWTWQTMSDSVEQRACQSDGRQFRDSWRSAWNRDGKGVFDRPVYAEEAPCVVHAFSSHCAAETTVPRKALIGVGKRAGVLRRGGRGKTGEPTGGHQVGPEVGLMPSSVER
jgi:hypothetical protein